MIKIITFLKPYIQKNLWVAIFYFIMTAILWSIGIFTPYLSGIYIDYLVTKIDVSIIVYFVIVIAFINILNIITQYISALLSTKLNNKLLHQLNSDSYQKIFRSKLSLFKDIDKYYLIDQINNDSATLVNFFSHNMTNIIFQFITIIVSAVIVFKADIFLGIVILFLVPIYIFTYLGFRNKLYNANLKYKTETNEYFSKKAEQITRLEFIKRNMVFDEMYQRFINAFNSMYSIATSQVKANYIFSNLNQFILIICYMFILGIGGYKVFTDKLSIGFFTIINTYFSMIISSTSYFLSLAGSYHETKVSVERLSKIHDSENELCGNHDIDEVNTINLTDLSIKYDSNNIINNLSYRFEKGKLYSIYGENGSGKTTLINSLIGLYSDLCLGQIDFDNIPITELNMPKLRRTKISFVEQTPEFLNLSIDEYLNFGIDMTENIKQYQYELIKSFKIDKFANNSTINESGNNFSGGEKQKLALVRALSKPGFLLILDEPTSALDSESVNTLIDILISQKDNKITLVVSHDKRILDACDCRLKIQKECYVNEK